MRSLLSLCVFVSLTLLARAVEPFEIKDGDRVLFLGDTLLERETTYGYLETRMHEQFPDRHFTVRNLSWSGETPRGWSRASFDNPDKGTERLKEDIAKVRPTVVFLGFGMAASLQEMTDRSGDITLNPDPARYGAEPMSAGRFKRELGELMEAIEKGAAVSASEASAAQPGGLKEISPGQRPGSPTKSGSRPERAQESPAPAGADAVGEAKPRVSPGANIPQPSGLKTAATPVRFVLLSPIRHEDLRAVKPGLPDPAEHNKLLEQYAKAIEELAQERAGRYVPLSGVMDLPIPSTPGRPVSKTDNGIHLARSGYAVFTRLVAEQLAWPPINSPIPSVAEVLAASGKPLQVRDPLRAAVIRKNELFFHQFRPANSTYLFGFRKHEQGQNAKEMPMFDPLIEAAEAEIDRLKKAGGAPSPKTGDAAKPSSAAEKVSSETGKLSSDSQKLSSDSQKLSPDSQKLSSDSQKPSSDSQKLSSDAAKLAANPPPLPDFTVEDGYQIELWAQNPYLEKPTQMNWDPQGRLWVCSSSLYPQIEPGQAANDKILVLSDTDGDGKADKSEVFAAGLLIPTGVVPDLSENKMALASGVNANPPGWNLSSNACYVGQSTELLYFRDTDGDGKADEKRIVFSGFGTEDTHHIVHTLHWGPDGRLYFHQSVYIHTHLETPWGMVRLNSGGVFAYDPRTERVEVFIKGLWNTWGQAEDEWGQSFFTDGAGSTGLTWGFPGAIFAPFEGSRRQMASISPGSYPKFAGLEIVKSPAFPAEWQGNAVTCDFRAHRIVRFAITDLSQPQMTQMGKDGEKAAATGNPPSDHLLSSAPSAASLKSGYTTVEQPDLVRTTDLSFRPIDVKLGPDGALYVADWSNPVINHGEVDFRDPRRDHHMGRIWRITKKDTPALKWEPVVDDGTDRVLDRLLSSNRWEQEQATQLTKTDNISFDRFFEWAAKQVPIPVIQCVQYMARKGIVIGTLEVKATNPAIVDYKLPQRTARMLADEILMGQTHFDPRIRAAVARWARAEELRRALDGGQFKSLDQDAVGQRDWMMKLGAPAQHADREMNSISYAHPSVRYSTQWSRDANPRVRLEAMRIAAQIPVASSASAVLDAALKTPENDPHYDFAAWLSINDLAQPWTDAIASGAWKTEGKEAQLAYGLNAIDPRLAGATIAKLLADPKVDLAKGPWIELIGHAGGPPELTRLYDSILLNFGLECCAGDNRDFVASRAVPFGQADALRAVSALLEAARVRNAKPDGELAFRIFANGLPPKLHADLARLAGYWKSKDAALYLTELAQPATTAPALRLAAIEGLRNLGGKEAATLLGDLTQDAQPLEIRRAACVALTGVNLDAGLDRAAVVLTAISDEAALLATWRELLQVQRAAEALARKFGDAAWAKNLPPPVIAAAARAAREAGRPGAKLVAALAPFASAGTNTAAISKDYPGLAAQTKQNGDPAKGELIYRRATSACVTCHAIGGAGGKVGPDMTSIGASAPLDYLIESILDPNAKVKEGFNAVTLALADGTQATGIQARETANEVILRDAAGTERAVPKGQIKSKTDIGSMMPPGLTATMQPREQLDMFAFLSQLGKPGPYDASKGQVARVWRLYPGTAAGEVVSATYDPAKNPGFPSYTLVDGRFVKDLLTEATMIAAGDADTVLLATQFQSSGKTRLNLTGAEKAWLDGAPLVLGGEVAPELANGTHTLVVKIGVKELPPVLRAESEDARFLGN